MRPDRARARAGFTSPPARSAARARITPGSGNGIKLESGTTLASGSIPVGTTASKGLTLDNRTAQGTILDASVGNVTLTFQIGTGATSLNGGTASLSNPLTNSSFISVLGDTAGELSFASNDTISIIDLTKGYLSLGTPYLLIRAADNADYLGLATSGGSDDGVALNGWVENLTLEGLPSGPNEGLYLENGDLEVIAEGQVVPEPNAWALMVGGLAALFLLQRYRNKS